MREKMPNMMQNELDLTLMKQMVCFCMDVGVMTKNEIVCKDE